MSCPDCTKGILLPGEPTGTLSVDGAYFAAGPQESKDRAIILLTDVFGLPLKNCKIIADRLAQRLSCDVWVPDLFDGKPIFELDQLKFPDRAGVKRSYWDWMKFILAALPSIPLFIRSRPSIVDGRISSFIEKLKREKEYRKLGAVGYCFGGIMACRLGATKLIDCIVICHPGRLSTSIIDAIKVPSSWACAEDDEAFPTQRRLEAEASLTVRKEKSDGPDYEFKDYKGTAHGFAIRPNLLIPEVNEGFEGSFEQTVEWFQKYLAD